MTQCDQCNHSSTNAESLKTHKRDYHAAVVYYGEGLTPVRRDESGFGCPVCAKNILTTRSFFNHLKQHNLNATLTKKRSLHDLTSDSSLTKQHQVDTEADEDRVTHIPPPSLSLETPPAAKLPRLTYRHVVLASTDSLTADETTQEDKMMLAKLGRWTPIIYNHDKMQYGMLTSSSTASSLLSQNQTTGVWRSPSNDDGSRPSVAVVDIDADHFIRHLKNTSKASKKMKGTIHEEATSEMIDLLNEDWLQYPQLRYCTSQLLAGAILVEGATAIVLNTIEPYSRDTLLDAHHERRLFGAASSFPSTRGRYGFLSICQLATADGLKLVIGSRTCNFLVTSSLRLDTISVNLGPVTSHFAPSPTTRLFLDASSIVACKCMLSKPTITRSQPMPTMYMLKQVRSKYDHLSTYTMCRASSEIASQLELQPLTIWTLSDQESNQAFTPQEKVASLLFREIATEVIKDGKNAVLRLAKLLEINAKAKKDSVVAMIFANIVKLFKDQDQIDIIGNASLNSQLTDLANSVSNKRENDKKIKLIIKALYD